MASEAQGSGARVLETRVPEARRRVGLGASLLALGAGLAANTLLGPLFADLVAYPVSEAMMSQTLALDGFSLLVAAPASLALGWAALRRKGWVPWLAFGPGLYAAYMFLQYIAGPRYLFAPETLVLQLLVFVLGWAVAAQAWSAIGGALPPRADPRRARVLGTILVALALFVTSRYLPVLLGSMAAAPLAPEAQDDPGMFWTILLLDVGLVVPVAAWAGVALWRGRGAAAWKAGYAVVGWFALTGPSVAAMGLAMVARGDAHASLPLAGVFVAIGLAAVAAAAWLFRGLD